MATQEIVERDIFDEIELDPFDEAEIDPEDKVIYSKEFRSALRSELRKEIANIPVGKIIARIMEKEVLRQEQSNGVIKASVDKELSKSKADVSTQISKLKEEMEAFIEKLKQKYADLKNEIAASVPQYQFGGFSPQFNDLNIGDPATEGSWRIVKAGTDLVVQRLESSTWTTKGTFTA